MGSLAAKGGVKSSKSIGKKLKEWGEPLASFTQKCSLIAVSGIIEGVYKTAFMVSWLLHKFLVLITLLMIWMKKHLEQTWNILRFVWNGIRFWVPELTKVIGILLFKGLTLLPVTAYRLLFKRN
jgi:hypothetical protein